MVYSCNGIVSKLAAGVDMISPTFVAYYAVMLGILGVYALGWQQILKRMPLTTAYSNRAVTIVWGIIWGFVFFAEPVTLPKVIGAIFIIAGVALFTYADAEGKPDVNDAQGQGGGVTQNGGAQDNATQNGAAQGSDVQCSTVNDSAQKDGIDTMKVG